CPWTSAPAWRPRQGTPCPCRSFRSRRWQAARGSARWWQWLRTWGSLLLRDSQTQHRREGQEPPQRQRAGTTAAVDRLQQWGTHEQADVGHAHRLRRGLIAVIGIGAGQAEGITAGRRRDVLRARDRGLAGPAGGPGDLGAGGTGGRA